ncbi:hypothetical protein BSG1_00295 [Bacillus sp. SG-1]|nr:hypothetical protein BSG1_00295 [Bacillus sp. SG-1]
MKTNAKSVLSTSLKDIKQENESHKCLEDLSQGQQTLKIKQKVSWALLSLT